jgi:hypothetical protein
MKWDKKRTKTVSNKGRKFLEDRRKWISLYVVTAWTTDYGYCDNTWTTNYGYCDNT